MRLSVNLTQFSNKKKTKKMILPSPSLSSSLSSGIIIQEQIDILTQFSPNQMKKHSSIEESLTSRLNSLSIKTNKLFTIDTIYVDLVDTCIDLLQQYSAIRPTFESIKSLCVLIENCLLFHVYPSLPVQLGKTFAKRFTIVYDGKPFLEIILFDPPHSFYSA